MRPKLDASEHEQAGAGAPARSASQLRRSGTRCGRVWGGAPEKPSGAPGNHSRLLSSIRPRTASALLSSFAFSSAESWIVTIFSTPLPPRMTGTPM